jgi:hypothetical protein
MYVDSSFYLYIGLILFIASYMVYHIDGVLRENYRLRNRNFELAGALQLAELQTGTPYYSATLRDLVNEKSGVQYYESLESRARGT